MPTTAGRNPKTYEEIIRKTVVDPDSSVRPTLDQERAAREGFRALDTFEQDLHERVVQALVAAGAPSVTVEVSRDLVTLRGRVADIALLRTIENATASVPGVSTIHNQIVVGSHRSP
jgi:BON domain